MIPGRRYTPEVLLNIAWRRKWQIILPAVLAATIASAVTYSLPNLYKSTTLILVVPQRVPESYVRPTVTTRIEDRLQSISQQILSRTRLEHVIEELNLYTDRRKSDLIEDIVERMRTKDIGIEIVKGDAFRVSFTANDPRTATKVTERLASLFIDESLRDREVLAEGTNQFLEGQLEDARRKLIENEKLLEDYRRRHDGQLPTQLEGNIQGLHNTEMQLQALIESLNRDRDRRLILERFFADAGREPIAAPPPPPVSRAPSGDDLSAPAADQLRSAQIQLQALEIRLKAQHPDVVKLKRLVAELQKAADAEAAQRPAPRPASAGPAEIARRTRLEDSKAELDNLDRQIGSKIAEEKRLRETMAEYQKRIEAAPTREAELSELTRDYDTLQQTYRALLVKKQDSQVAANLERRQIGEQFKVLDRARLPEKPFSPDRPKLYLAGILLSMALAFGFAAGAEYLDRGLRSEEDVRAALNLLVLATIPKIVTSAAANRYRVRALAVSVSVGAAAIASAVIVAWKFLR